MRRLFLVGAVASAVALSSVGCASKPVVAAEKAAASVLISNQQEEQLGSQLHQQLQKEGMKFVSDPQVVKYVTEVARPILQAAKRERPEVSWQLFVVDSPEVNAFATPGGNIYVQTGLIRAASNEAELAGVLAHEAGHVVGRHAARNMVQALGLQTVAGLALGENPSQLKQVAAALLANGALLHHSRSQEIEADEYGARFSHRGGYDPNGLIAFFRTLQRKTGEMPRLLTWLSTHPQHSDRIANLQQYIAQNNLRGGATTKTNQLAQIQQKLGGPLGTGGGGAQ